MLILSAPPNELLDNYIGVQSYNDLQELVSQGLQLHYYDSKSRTYWFKKLEVNYDAETNSYVSE